MMLSYSNSWTLYVRLKTPYMIDDWNSGEMFYDLKYTPKPQMIFFLREVTGAPVGNRHNATHCIHYKPPCPLMMEDM